MMSLSETSLTDFRTTSIGRNERSEANGVKLVSMNERGARERAADTYIIKSLGYQWDHFKRQAVKN